MERPLVEEDRFRETEQFIIGVDDGIVPFLRCCRNGDAGHLILEHLDGAGCDFLGDARAAGHVVFKAALVHIFFDHGIGIGIADDELALVGAEGNADDGDAPLASLADVLDEVDVVVAKAFGRNDAAVDVEAFQERAQAVGNPEFFVIDLRRADEDDANEVQFSVLGQAFD